jgi:Tol biopolymer transport system component
LTWVDRSGKPLDRVGDPGYYYGFAASPDRRKAVLEGFGPSGKPEVWLIEFANGIASKLTEGNTPVWDARSERVLYIDLQSKLEAIEISSGKKEPVLPTAVETLGGFLQGVSPDGRYLAWTTSTGGQSDPFVAALDGSEKPRRYLQTPSNEFRTQVSPDGKWIAYVSNESGSDQVMVDSFPQAGQRRRISPEGGAFPEWRPDGRELYYLAPAAGARRKLMVVRVESGTTFTASRPEFVFETPELGTNPRRGQFAVFGNGEKFLMNVAVPETKPRAITLVVNWPALLK